MQLRDGETPSSSLASCFCKRIHLGADDNILPGQEVASRHPNIQQHQPPNLSRAGDATTEVQISILEPICRELGVESWFKELCANAIARTWETLKGSLKTVAIGSPKWKPKDPNIRYDRRLKWRGEEMADTRIAAVGKVPNDCVEGFRNKSTRLRLC